MREPTYPLWIDSDPIVNLREVAPGLFVGAQFSPRAPVTWALVVDFYGQAHPPGAVNASRVLRIPFSDGTNFPPRALDEVHRAVRHAIGTGPILIHCQAGLSRSVSAMYAMLRALYGFDHATALKRVHGGVPGFPMPSTFRSARRWLKSR